MLALRSIEPFHAPSGDEAAAHDRMFYHSDAGVRFVAETHGATPVCAELRDGGVPVGHLYGLIFSRYGIRVFGSPFPGWTTPYMGFSLRDGVPRRSALEAVERFAFRELGCLHFEVVDRYLSEEDGRRVGLSCGWVESYETDLTSSEDAIFGSFSSACRRCLRKAEKSGLTIEEAHDPEFADEFYEQLKDVFRKQRLVPTYDAERVRALVRNLRPTGGLLLLRARDPDGRCIATGIYPGMNRIAQMWGNASFRTGQHLRPNESLHWYAMRYWKWRGAERFDWGGGGTYKEKYGCRPIRVPRFHKSRFAILSHLRDSAERLVYRGQSWRGWLQTVRGAP